MGQTKELYMAAHERLMEEYMEAHPDASDEEAYENTADHAYGRMIDDMGDMADRMRQLRKDGML